MYEKGYVGRIGNVELEERKDGKALTLVFLDGKENRVNASVESVLNKDEMTDLYEVLKGFVEAQGKEVVDEDKAYTEWVEYFKDGIERSLTINGYKEDQMRLSMVVYTDIDYDDHWMDLTVGRAKKFAEVIGGYLV